ncbi:MAG: hypothetical protein WCD70_09275 [Alphaproteobacteria bacterium]
MTKISDKARKQIADLQDAYKKLTKKKEAIERKDWFLVDVKFTPETIAAHQAELKAFPDVLAAWQKEQATSTKPENEKTFGDLMEPSPPLQLSVYNLSDFLHQGRRLPELSSLGIETHADGTGQRYAIRAREFAVLEQKPHILSITVVDRGERVAALVEAKMSHIKLASLKLAPRPAPRPAIDLPPPPKP